MKLSGELKQAMDHVRASKQRLDLAISVRTNPNDPEDNTVQTLTREQIIKIAKVHSPRLSEFCREAITRLQDETQLKGQSPELDRLKNEVFHAWGMATGEDLV